MLYIYVSQWRLMSSRGSTVYFFVVMFSGLRKFHTSEVIPLSCCFSLCFPLTLVSRGTLVYEYVKIELSFIFVSASC